VNSPKRRVRLAAWGALGTLGDPKAAAVLEKFASAGKGTPERAAAERALTAVRESRRPSADLGGIRNDLMNLQRENRELRKDLDDLKKRLEAVTAKPSGGESGAPKSGAKPAKR
jgi:HEAT repeat protein